MRVLVVEDDVIAAELLEHALTKVRLRSDRCLGRNVEALEQLRDNDFRLVISDWEMPRMNGIELCRRVREDFDGRYIYFILLTSRSGTQNVVEGLGAGADEFISKPFEPDELYVRLRVARRILALRKPRADDLQFGKTRRVARSRNWHAP